MSLNGLTVSAGLKLVPLILETLVKHYFERLKATPQASATTSSDGAVHDGKHSVSALDVNLRQENLLYDQTFVVAKEFVATASLHTIEEMQQFAKTKTPSPPWVRVSRVLVPMSCCDQAAEHLIDALGGESTVKEIVGGTKWWQIRDVNGVDAEWIVAKKDWQEVEKRAKSKERRDKSKERRGKERGKSSQQSTTTDSAPAEDTSEPDHTPDMDEQRCILYFHGGAYYFGSVDQERYSIQRFARDINGRAFAINYRLSPQYPFPCAIQDALAAYLYLIRPPPEAKHKPVKPQHIVIMGNSAGGGLSLALLQVIRDSGLPPCAGGVLISPWCDARHSFPSVYMNTETDFLPYHCLAMHKPSILWPPPTNAESDTVRQSVRSRLRRVTEDQGRLKSFLGSRGHASPPEDETITSEYVADGGILGTSTSVSRGRDQIIALELDGGETLNVDTQIHFYAPNNLLPHPLISPCGAYLGGLPPLLFTAGNQEVLRDEIVYTAHRAADPSKFPIPAASRQLYPRMTDIEAKHPTPTKVHLQVYDGCAHILPILFVFTTFAKHCFRAIASFCRFATGMEFPSSRLPSPTAEDGPTSPQQRSFFSGSSFTSPPEEVGDPLTESRGGRSWWGEGEDSLMSKSYSGTGKADKGKSKEKATKENRENLKGESRGGEYEVEEVEAKSKGFKEDVQKGSTDHPGPRKVEKDDIKAEAVGKAGVVDSGYPPFGEDRTGEARTVDQQLKAEADDDAARSLGDAKSFRSLISRKSTNKSQEGTKSGKSRLSLAIARGSAPEKIPAPSRGLADDVAGGDSRFKVAREPERQRRTGDCPSIYVGGFVGTNFIRERVSIRGVTRPLEPEAELPAFQLKADLIGAVSELPLRRYIEAKAEYEVRFSDTLKSIVKERERNLKLAHEEDDRSLGHLESYLQKVTEKSERGQTVLDSPRLQKITADSWNWSWAMDEDEDPPLSSIVSRRDTWEARQLATIADIMPESTLGNLWQHLVTFLTVAPNEVELPAEREHPGPGVGGQRESDWTGVSAPLEVNTEVNAATEDSPVQTCTYVYPF